MKNYQPPAKGKLKALSSDEQKSLYLHWGREPIDWMRYFFPNYFFKPPAAFHYELAHNFYHGPPEQTYEASRGHAKTTLLEFLAFHSAVYYRTMFELFISETEPIASQRLVDLQNECESNDAFRAFYGDLVTPKWGEKEFIIKNAQMNIMCKFLARGLGQQVIGIKWLFRRPDLVIIDDPEDVKTAENPTNVDKSERWLIKEVIPGRADNGRLFMVTTPITADCLAERVRKNYRHIKFKRFGCWEEDPKTGARKALWPEHKNIKQLDQIRQEYADIGQLWVFYTEYLCNPLPPDKHPFQEDLFDFVEEPTLLELLEKNKLNIFILGDLAIGEKKRHAYSAIQIIGVDSRDTWYHLDEFNAKIDTVALAMEYYKYRDEWDPQDVGIEDFALQKMFWSVLQLVAEREKYIPIYAVPITQEGDKNVKTMRLLPRFKMKKILFRRGKTMTKEQLILFDGKDQPKFRDLIDALALAHGFVYGPGLSAPQKNRVESWRKRMAATVEELEEEDKRDEELRAEAQDDWERDMWD